MKSVRALGRTPISLPLSADDITELHAARLLLLFHHCGSGEKIEGLTKLAKLDFFVRYPSFFERAGRYLGKAMSAASDQTESPMVRHHYGPWDKRYYQVLAFLEARGLITVQKRGRAYDFTLTELGQERAKLLSKSQPFAPLIEQMQAVKKLLGRKNGTQLKNIVYEIFDEEVKQRRLGELIK
ncbi:MAG: hypothetical protein A2091_13650 [Desulfuromonadales bacterium GWD2_61_12]|nr:MAG: hypothetical protein A2091_13650 [Desulfuromonadales bacterium GWD2_61_12]